MGSKVFPTDYGQVPYNIQFLKFKENGKSGYSIDGIIVIEPIYDKLWQTSFGFVITEVNGKYGFINNKYKEIVAPKYEDVGSFYEGMAKVKRNGKWGYINTDGQEVIPIIYDEAGIFSGGISHVKQHNMNIHINKNGDIVFGPY